MKKYRPKDEKHNVIRQLLDLGIKVTSTNGVIDSIECDESLLQQVKTLTKMDFEEVIE